MALNMRKGWYGESHRHSLARKGIKTSRKSSIKNPIIKKALDESERKRRERAVKMEVVEDTEHGGKRLEEKHIKTKVNSSNQVDYIIAYEEGRLSDKDTVQLFSYLVSSGMAWTLQGHYGRTAQGMIEDGFIDRQGKINREKYQYL